MIGCVLWNHTLCIWCKHSISSSISSSIRVLNTFHTKNIDTSSRNVIVSITNVIVIVTSSSSNIIIMIGESICIK